MADYQTRYILEGDTDSLVEAVKAAAKAVEKLGDTAKATDKQLQAVGLGSKKTANALGDLRTRLQKAVEKTKEMKKGTQGLNKELKEQDKRAAALAVALGPVAGALAAVATIAAASAAAVGVFGAALIGSVLAADELNDELDRFRDHEGFEPIAPGALAAIEMVNTSLKALGVIADRLVVALGTELAPALADAAFVMVKLGLVGLDTFQTFTEGKDLLVELGVFLQTSFVRALAAPLFQLVELYDGIGQVAEALGAEGLGNALRGGKRELDRLTDAIARPVAEGVLGATTDAIETLGKATGDYDKRARDLLGSLRELDDENEENKKSVEDSAKGWGDLISQIEKGAAALDKIAEANRFGLTAEDKLRDAYDKKIEKLGEIEAQTRKNLALIDEEIAKAKENKLSTEDLTEARSEGALSLMQIDKQRLASLEALSHGLEKLDDTQKDHLGTVGTVAKAYEDAFGAAIDFVMSQTEVMTNAQREGLLVLYRLQQAAAITSIIIDTAQAIMKAQTLGPIAGTAAGLAIGAMGAAQLAVVTATPPPFHVGGIIPDGAGLASVLPGESVLTREATAKLGTEGVRDLNSGMGSPTIVVEQVYKHKIFDSFVQDNINKGGPLASAIRGTSRVGRA